MLSRLGIAMMLLLGRLPLAWVRALGCGLGWMLYVLAIPRRRVAQTNLHLCFPDRSATQIRALTLGTFVHFAQAWLDRGWLWHGAPEVVRRRLTLTGAVAELQGQLAAKNSTPAPAAAPALDPRPVELTGNGATDKAIQASGCRSLAQYKAKAKRDQLFAAAVNMPPGSIARACAESNLAVAQRELANA